MRIVIATGGLKFNGNTINEKALGGSETWLCYISKEFAKLGHDVRVYCSCDNPGVYDNVLYEDVSRFKDFIMTGECDIFICSRHYDLLASKLNSKLNVLVNHDILADHVSLVGMLWNLDMVYCLSNYHKELYLEKMKEFEKHIYLSSNGIDLSIVPTGIAKKHKIMFTSRPERGLFNALKVYESMGDKSLEFEFCNYPTLNDANVQEIERLCILKAKELNQKGFKVTFGQYPKAELYKHIAEAKAVYYETDFPEIFCISALEAQACGTVFIAPNKYAFPQTCAYVFTDCKQALKDILASDKLRLEYESKGLNHAQKYSWESVALKMLEDFDNQFASRDKLKKIDRMIYNSDIVIAKKILEATQNKTEAEIQKEIQIDNMLRFVNNPELLKDIYEDEETHEKLDLSWESIKANARFNWAAEEVKRAGHKSVLDFACHMGWGSIIMSNANPDCKFTGYDISSKAVNKAKIRIEKFANNKDNLTFTSNIADLTDRFDAVFCGEYLEHTINPKAEVEKLLSLVKDGGKIYLTIPKGAWEFLSRKQNLEKDVYYHIQGFEIGDIELMFGSQKDYDCMVMQNMHGSYGECLGNYLISFTKSDEPIGDNLCPDNLMYKLHTSREHVSISACVIAKNAEKSIERMLDSLKDSLGNYEPDEIILGDDNSNDDTIGRAIKKGCKVFPLPKEIINDKWGFANARNATIEKAKGDWILWVDSDEEVKGIANLRKWLDSNIFNAFAIKQHHPQLDNFIEADKPHRLFRRGTGTFYGYIHEQPMTINDINEPISPALIMCDAKIINYGAIDERQRRDKSLGRNLILLKVDAKENVTNREKAGLTIRKLTIILMMRDFLNRMSYNYERFKTYNTKDVRELCIPMIEKLYNKYFKNETDLLYKGYADKYLSQAYELSGLGDKITIEYQDKKIEQYVRTNEQLASILEDIKK